MPAHAHKLIYVTACEMAHELYDTMMSDNLWYETWKKSNPGLGPRQLEARFVAKNVSVLLPQARHTLAGMLGNPAVPEDQKVQISEALILDHQLRGGVRRTVSAHAILNRRDN